MSVRWGMGFFSKLFASRPAVPPVPPCEARCVRIPGCHLIDLTPVPADSQRVLRAVGQLRDLTGAAREPLQIWVWPQHLTWHYRAADPPDHNALTMMLALTSYRAERKVFIDMAPGAVVMHMLETAGFTVVKQRDELPQLAALAGAVVP